MYPIDDAVQPIPAFLEAEQIFYEGVDIMPVLNEIDCGYFIEQLEELAAEALED